MLRRWLLVSLLLSVACGDDDRVAMDGGPARDLGGSDMGRDAGGSDAAMAEDAAAPSDAGASDDAGTDAGGETETDLGPAEDGGPAVECVDGPLTLDAARSATTIGGADVRNPDGSDCLAAFASGPERVFSFTAPDADDYRITVTPDNGTFDPMVYVQPTCDDESECLAIAGLNGPGTADATTMTLTAGQNVLITVDTDLRMSGDTSGGPFTILVARDL